MKHDFVVAALALVLATAVHVAIATEDGPPVPPRGAEGADVRLTETAPYRPCPEWSSS